MNVKPKDLAMVVNANHPDWDGATCTVLEAAHVDPNTVTCGGPYWLVLFSRPMPVDDGTVCRLDVKFPDLLLRKIGGPDVDTRSFDEVIAGHALEAQS